MMVAVLSDCGPCLMLPVTTIYVLGSLHLAKKLGQEEIAAQLVALSIGPDGIVEDSTYFPQLPRRKLLQTKRWRGFRGNERTHQMGDNENAQRAIVKAVGGAVEELARGSSAMVIATPGGRFQVRWDEGGSATALGQL